LRKLRHCSAGTRSDREAQERLSLVPFRSAIRGSDVKIPFKPRSRHIMRAPSRALPEACAQRDIKHEYLCAYGHRPRVRGRGGRGVHDLMNRDVVELRSQLANDGETLADNLGSLVQRVSLSCAQEIDGLIRDLKMLRERLHHDGAWRAR